MKKLLGSRAAGALNKGRLSAVAALLLVLLGQPGCKKSEAQPLSEYKASLYLASPANDGPPVDELVLDSTHETLVPINKKDGWPLFGTAQVSVRYIDTGRMCTVTGMNGQIYHFREVYIVSFRLL